MHFSIPDTQDIKDGHGSYIAYNVYINGSFHCTLRYRQIHNLHDQLRREFGPAALPVFPPKKFLPLTPTQIEERRILLEKYVQQISQDPKVAESEIFIGFLFNAQQETQNARDEDVELDIYLMNWQKVGVRVSSLDRTSTVMKVLLNCLNLEDQFMECFCLYLVLKRQNEISVERRLLDFESPYLSLKTAGCSFHIAIRKSYWDSSGDEKLMENKVALNLLYVQAVSDVEQGWTQASEETRKHLANLQSRGSKFEYVRVARTLKHYGYIQFRPCVCDYPKPNTLVTVSAGGRDLIFRFPYTVFPDKEIMFRVTKIKCWRITTSATDNPSILNPTSQLSSKLRLELSFEYLISKDDLKWISVVSDQAILMSACLQGMVDELLNKRSGDQNESFPKRMSRSGSWNYMKRDGSSYQITSSVCRSVSHDAIVNSANRQEAKFSQEYSKSHIMKISGKLSGVSGKHAARNGSASLKELVENDAFDGIGDDDL